jgi:hypothetical protein
MAFSSVPFSALRRRIFFDLPYSLGVVTPCYLDLRTSKAKPKYLGDWYAALTAQAWTEKNLG